MPIALISNWRLLAAAGLVLAAFLAGMHVQGGICDRRAAALAEAQREATAKAQAELDRKAKVAELELAAERTKSADLQTQWETARREKSHTVCRLSDRTIGVLKDATAR